MMLTVNPDERPTASQIRQATSPDGKIEAVIK
jgi:hypothetical protein